MRATSRPETALFCNLGVRLRIPLCGVHEYASAEILAFLDLAEKSLVSASATALSPSGVSGWEWALGYELYSEVSTYFRAQTAIIEPA